MQTFLPYPDFEKSAKCLDYRRLGKQRVEAYQLLDLMMNMNKKSWRNHPAFKMWDGYDIALIDYGIAICLEWEMRGYKDNMGDRFINVLMEYPPYGNFRKPRWLGDPKFHASHRSNLLRKNYDYYSKFGWTEPDDLPYVWPEGM